MGGVHEPDGSPDVFVWGMWVEPESRGQGLAGRILVELLDRVSADGRTVRLHVTGGNARARRLYEAHGFVSAGEWQPLREGSALRIEALQLEPPVVGVRGCPATDSKPRVVRRPPAPPCLGAGVSRLRRQGAFAPQPTDGTVAREASSLHR